MRAFEHKQHGAELRKMCGQLLKSIVAKNDDRSSVDSMKRMTDHLYLPRTVKLL
jgi:hypothetical protein